MRKGVRKTMKRNATKMMKGMKKSQIKIMIKKKRERDMKLTKVMMHMKEMKQPVILTHFNLMLTWTLSSWITQYNWLYYDVCHVSWNLPFI
jgi:hypothetical protein